MNNAIRSHIVKIGNSQGIRIPKPLLEQSGIKGEVEIELQDGGLMVRPVQHPRQGWEEAFSAMSASGDDRLLDAETTTAWDEVEWEWS
ncbi:AbrB/MazE/SpoVT family DNA-binding domain-containing protein [Vacuolonema iberomarrocanum]|uniref:AbrB/MazE/SpoVT family DNA-binding domain-containing protein n=1 Tax=Vacuolonema iberomarrocanum TaxID=3454632 RepID=UPI0019E259A8|nr:AbrB/MazE/SpoVT family DNA-binding domain-containing protein [filamentous cyanobacterium LEGE 07170]